MSHEEAGSPVKLYWVHEADCYCDSGSRSGHILTLFEGEPLDGEFLFVDRAAADALCRKLNFERVLQYAGYHANHERQRQEWIEDHNALVRAGRRRGPEETYSPQPFEEPEARYRVITIEVGHVTRPERPKDDNNEPIQIALMGDSIQCARCGFITRSDTRLSPEQRQEHFNHDCPGR